MQCICPAPRSSYRVSCYTYSPTWASTALWCPPAETSRWTCSLWPEEEEEEQEQEVYLSSTTKLLAWLQGGGGAGALLSYTDQVKVSGSYTISVGVGGAGGANGGNSSAFNWIAIGGGAGGPSCISASLHHFDCFVQELGVLTGMQEVFFFFFFFVSSADVLINRRSSREQLGGGRNELRWGPF